jgi:hypothetical protein
MAELQEQATAALVADKTRTADFRAANGMLHAQVATTQRKGDAQVATQDQVDGQMQPMHEIQQAKLQRQAWLLHSAQQPAHREEEILV